MIEQSNTGREPQFIHVLEQYQSIMALTTYNQVVRTRKVSDYSISGSNNGHQPLELESTPHAGSNTLVMLP